MGLWMSLTGWDSQVCSITLHHITIVQHLLKFFSRLSTSNCASSTEFANSVSHGISSWLRGGYFPLTLPSRTLHLFFTVFFASKCCNLLPVGDCIMSHSSNSFFKICRIIWANRTWCNLQQVTNYSNLKQKIHGKINAEFGTVKLTSFPGPWRRSSYIRAFRLIKTENPASLSTSRINLKSLCCSFNKTLCVKFTVVAKYYKLGIQAFLPNIQQYEIVEFRAICTLDFCLV